MRSDMIKKGSQQAPARSLLHATGALHKPTDMNKPFVAICNSYIDIVPGHVHLRELADIAKDAIREAGAIPFEFNTIGIDDGIAMGHIGMRYSLPSREIIADAAETVINAHWFDVVFSIPNCDKISPQECYLQPYVQMSQLFFVQVFQRKLGYQLKVKHLFYLLCLKQWRHLKKELYPKKNF